MAQATLRRWASRLFTGKRTSQIRGINSRIKEHKARLKLEWLEGREVPSTSIPLSGTAWAEIGPRPIISGQAPGRGEATGRFDSFASDPTDFNLKYAASSVSGLWRATGTFADGSPNWAPINNAKVNNLSMLRRPNGTTTMYASAASSFLMSANAQAVAPTFSTLGAASFTNRTIVEFVVVPDTSTTANHNDQTKDVIYAAVQGNAANPAGIYRSKDGGATWVNITPVGSFPFAPATLTFNDVDIDPTNREIVYASINSGPEAGLYRCTNGYTSNTPNWQLRLGGGTAFSGTVPQKLQTVISPSVPGAIFVAVYGLNGGAVSVNRIYTSSDSGLNWTPLFTAPDWAGGQGNVYGSFGISASSPADPTRQILFGAGFGDTGNNVVVSFNSGVTWQNISVANVLTSGTFFGPYAGVRDLNFDPTGKLMVATDGGVYSMTQFTLNAGGTALTQWNWQSLNGKDSLAILDPARPTLPVGPEGLNSVQMGGFALHPNNVDRAVGNFNSLNHTAGLFQDKYGWVTTDSSPAAPFSTGGNNRLGSGQVFYDFNNPNTVYRVTPFDPLGGWFRRSDDGGLNWFDQSAIGLVASPAQLPFNMNPSDPNEIYYAADDLYLYTAAPPAWAALGAPTVTLYSDNSGNQANGTISAQGMSRQAQGPTFTHGLLFIATSATWLPWEIPAVPPSAAPATRRLWVQNLTADGAWTEIALPASLSPLAAANTITSITVDPNNRFNFYITTQDGRIFRQTAATLTATPQPSPNPIPAPPKVTNATFAQINGGAVAAGSAIRGVVIDPGVLTAISDDTIYLGNNNGVFSLVNPAASTNWTAVGTGLPTGIAITDIDINTTTGILAASTDGRGVYELLIRNSITGQVFGDNAVGKDGFNQYLSGNGIRDGSPQEALLSGRIVGLTDTSTNAVIATTTTDAQGRYSFRSVPTGKYTVEFFAPAGWHQTTSVANVDFSAGPFRTETLVQNPLLEIGAYLDGQIKGIKFDDLDGDGTFDGGEPGLGNFRIYVDTNNDGNYNVGEPFVFSSPDGTYSLDNLGPRVIKGVDQSAVAFAAFSDFIVREDPTSFPPGGWSQSSANPGAIKATYGDVINGVNFGNVRRGVIRGVKFNDFDSDQFQDAGEPGLSGWVFFLDSNQDGDRDWTDGNANLVWDAGEGEQWTTTDATGAFEFNGLPNGPYQIREVQQAGWSQTVPTSGFYNVNLTPTAVINVRFGNVQLRTQWIEIGPKPISNGETVGTISATGRFDSIAVDPLDPNVMFAASAVGGIWKSTNGGQTWISLLDHLDREDIPTIQTGNPTNGATIVKVVHRNINQAATIYAASALGTNGFLYMSNDGGTTWTHRGPTPIVGAPTSVSVFDNRRIMEFVVVPDPVTQQNDLIYAAVQSLDGSTATPAGIYRSKDGGVNWTNITGVSADGLTFAFPFAPQGLTFSDVDVDPTNREVVYASVNSGSRAGVYRMTNGYSTDGAIAGPTKPNWVLRLGGSSAFSGTLPTRVQTTISPVKSNVLFVAVASNTGGLLGIYRTFDTGTNWTPLLSTSFSPFGNVPDFTGGAANPYMTIAVDPFSPNNQNQQRLYAAGFGDSANNIIFSNDSGNNWSDISTHTPAVGGGLVGPYSGVRTETFDSQGRLLVATEGGIYRRFISGSPAAPHWESLNGVGSGALDSSNINRFGLGLHPTDPNAALANDGPLHTAALYTGGLAWQTVDSTLAAPFHNLANNPAGVGPVLYDFNSPQVVWRVAQDSATTQDIRLSNTGGVTWLGGLGLGLALGSPVIMNPADSRALIVGDTDANLLAYDAGGNITYDTYTNIYGAAFPASDFGGSITSLGMARQNGYTYASSVPGAYNWEPLNVRTHLYIHVPNFYGPGAGEWIEIDLPFAFGTTGITQILVDPNNSLSLYMTTSDGRLFSGVVNPATLAASPFTPPNFTISATWTQLNPSGGANLAPSDIVPNATGTNVIALDPLVATDPTDDVIYMGTNNGVYSLKNPSGAGPFIWTRIGGNELPNTPVTALQVNSTTGLLGVGTAGRGVWTFQIRTLIRGQIFDDLNGDGVKDFGEPGIDGTVPATQFIVNLVDVPSNTVVASTNADTNGVYEFRSVSAGNYRVELQGLPAWTTTTTPMASGGFTVDDNDTVLASGTPHSGLFIEPSLNFGNYADATINGKVFEDSNQNGSTTPDAGENGIAGFTVFVDWNNSGTLDWTDGDADNLWDAGEGEMWTTSDVNGDYSLTPFGPAVVLGNPANPAPPWLIRQILPGGWIQTTPDQNVGIPPLTSGRVLDDINLGNARPGSIRGLKFLDANSNGRFETGEPGLANWTFYVDLNLNNSKDGGEPFAVTDSNGTFQITGLGAGTYRVREVLQAGWVQTTTNPPDAVLTGTNSVSGLLFGNVQIANFRIINNWTPIGPAPQLNGGTWGNASVSGRVWDVVTDPTNVNRYFEVSESGGIWRTLDGGATWKNVTDGIAGIDNPYMSAMAMAASNTNILYASTANGLIKSIDGGNTWTLDPNGPSGADRIQVAISDPNIVFAAAGGLWRSLDGGQTWDQFPVAPGVAITDIQLDPTNPSVVFAAAGAAGGHPNNGLYRTLDALTANPTFTLMFGGSAQVPGTAMGEFKIALAPSQPSTIYASLATANVGGSSFYLATYRSNDSGVNWTKLVNTPDYLGSQADFNNAIVVHPTNPSIVYVGGVGSGPAQAVNMLLVTNDAGTTWGQTIIGPPAATFGPHTDVHMMAFDAQGRLLAGTDGGTFRLNNALVAPPFNNVQPQWESLNGGSASTAALNTIQFVGIATHPTDPNQVAGGSQDNGIGLYSGKIQWTTTNGGDAGEVLWDFDRPNNLYRIAPIASVGATSYVQKSIDGGNSWFDATDGIQGQTEQNTLFYGPIIMDPGNSQRLFTATDKVWASITGGEPAQFGQTQIAGWSQNVNINNLPAGITGATVVIPDTPLTNQDPPIPITALGMGRANPNQLYVAQGGSLFTIAFRVNPQLQTTDWVDITPPGAGTITRIILDPSAANTIYVIDGSDVYRSTNGGNTWNSLNGSGSGRLPFGPISIALDPRTFTNGNDDILYVGTIEGVYGLVNPNGTGFSWFRVGDLNLPVTEVRDLDLNTTTGILAAGTYGRGVWETRVRGQITGSVYNDLNGDAVQQSGETGISGVTIRLLDATAGPSFGTVVATTQTNAQGVYDFGSIRNGNYSVQMVPLTNHVQTTADPGAFMNFTEQSVATPSYPGTPPLSVTVDPRLNFGDYTKATIQGVKFDDSNANGVRDVGEGGLGTFVIYVDANTNNARDVGETSTTSAADGSWTLTGFGPVMVRGVATNPATWQIREDLTGQTGWIQTTPNPLNVSNLQSAEVRTGINIGNSRPGSLRGEVFFDVNADTIHNPGEPGEDAWRVYIDANSNNLFDTGETFVRTDATGVFSFTTLPPGTYRVRIDIAEQLALGERWFQTTPDPNDVTLNGNNSVGGITFGVFKALNPWIEIGPRPITNGQVPGRAPATGRFDSVAVDPVDPNVLYAGSQGGGIWRSTDGGTTWSVRSEALPDLFINTVKTFHRNGGNTVYAAAATGVYVSIDGGTNFTLRQIEPLNPLARFTAMDVVANTASPNNPGTDILFVTGTTGVYRSIDGGQTWTNISNGFPGGGANQPFTDIDIEPGQTTPNVVYVALGAATGVANSGVYRIDNAMTASPSTPGTWVLRLGGSAFVPGVEPGVFRVSIAPNAPSTLFVSVAERNAPNSNISRLLGIFRSFDSGINWTGFYGTHIMPSGNVPNYMDIFGNRNNSIIVSPFASPGFAASDPTHQVLVVGGYGDGGPGAANVLVSLDSGTTWTAANDLTAGSNGVGPSVDIHGFSFDSTGRLLAATEGGVFRLSSVTGTSRNWISLNGTPGLGSLNTVSVAPQGLATHPTNPYEMFINAGIDHTSVLYSGRLPVGYGWTSLDTRTDQFQQNFLGRHGVGDGPAGGGRDGNGWVFYNYNDPNVVYRVVDYAGGGDIGWIRKGIRPNSPQNPTNNWVWTSSAINVPGVPGSPRHMPAVIIDPSNSNHLWAGTTTQVAISNNGGQTWGSVLQTSISSSTPIPPFPNPPQNPPAVSSVAVSRTPNPNGTPNIFAGWNGFTWALTTLPVASPPATAATSDSWQIIGPEATQIIVDPNDPFNVYLVTGTDVFNWNGNVLTQLTGIGDPSNPNLPPSAPGATAIALDPRVAADPTDDVLYLGTSSGVFKLVNPSRDSNPGPYIWAKVGSGLPNEPITALDVNTTTGLLTAGTSGRGVWQVQIRAMIAGKKFDDINGDGKSWFDTNNNNVKDGAELDKPTIAGVVFRIIDNSTNGVVATTVTDAAGIYEFRSLRAGSYRVEEVPPANSVQTSQSPPVLTLQETDSALVSYILPGAVPASVTLEPRLAFGNFRFSTISGTKFEDRNNNGTRDTGEPGIQGFVIDLFKDSGGGNFVLQSSLTTDANGNYSFANLGPGIYRVREQNQVGWTQSSVNPADFTPTSGQIIGGINFGNIRTGRLTGTVFNDLNGDGTRTPNEPGAQNITVQLLDSGGSLLRTVASAADGTYEFLSLPFGTYTVRQLTPPATGWIQTSPVSPPNYTRTIDSTTPQLSNLDFGDFKLFSVSGLKFEDLNGDGIRGPGEVGVGGFTIEVRNVNTNAIFTGVSDANGNYTIPNLGPGRYAVTERSRTGWVQTSANPADFDAISGTDRTFNYGNFRLISIAGTVYNDANGNTIRDGGEAGLVGFEVVLRRGATLVGSAITDANGNYSFASVGPGNYTLTQSPKNGWRITTPPNGQYTFTAVSSVNQITGRDFGNISGGIFAFGRDAGSIPQVSVRNIGDNSEKLQFDAYSRGFTGGVRVATGFVNGKGSTPLIITAPGAGGGPHIRAFDSNTGEERFSFFAYAPNFSGGVFVATGDVDGDGFDDIITGAGSSASHVKVFSGATKQVIFELFAYNPFFNGGVRVAAGDVDGDGKADIITGTGPGAAPHMRVFSGITGQVIRENYAYDPRFSGGIFVAAGDFNGDGSADIVTTAGPGGGPHLKIFDGRTFGLLAERFAYETSFTGGARAFAMDLNFDGHADLITAPGAGRQPTILEYELQGAQLVQMAPGFNAFDPSFLGGVFVG